VGYANITENGVIQIIYAIIRIVMIMGWKQIMSMYVRNTMSVIKRGDFR